MKESQVKQVLGGMIPPLSQNQVDSIARDVVKISKAELDKKDIVIEKLKLALKKRKR